MAVNYSKTKEMIMGPPSITANLPLIKKLVLVLAVWVLYSYLCLCYWYLIGFNILPRIYMEFL